MQFPVQWHGRLLMHAEAADVEAAVKRIYLVLGLGGATIAPGRKSSSARYVTWQVSAVVPDLATLRKLFAMLESLPGLKMLI
ncbi:MAG TPA: hypothetical protein PKY10_00065 [Lentisphaeria bacterium]|nr:hypothetical protein [Lentisphaeria bacterium]